MTTFDFFRILCAVKMALYKLKIHSQCKNEIYIIIIELSRLKASKIDFIKTNHFNLTSSLAELPTIPCSYKYMWLTTFGNVFWTDCRHMRHLTLDEVPANTWIDNRMLDIFCQSLLISVVERKINADHGMLF